jgi:hypothetical protein
MFPLVETILALVPLHVGCGVDAHSSGILACFCFVLQRYGEEAPSYQKQDFWH